MTVGLGGGASILNVAVGVATLPNNNTGTFNTAVGLEALYSNTSGGNNTAIGAVVLFHNTTGDSNTAVGFEALFSNTAGGYSTAVGYQALYSNGSGSNNVAFGYSALYSNSDGGNNTAVGLQALYYSTHGSSNTAMGHLSLLSNTTGSNNTAVGWEAGYTVTPGNANVSGSNNTWIGFQAGPGTATQLNNATALGTGALNLNSNEVSLGNSSVTSLLIASVPGITQTSLSAITAIATTCGIVTTLTGTSDERLKNAVPFEDGLAAVMAITPVRYTWNKTGLKYTKLEDREYIGFIAQDVQRAIPEAITGTEGEEKYLSLSDRPILAALVSAVKELTTRIKELENKGA
jgi:hypothetical protein